MDIVKAILASAEMPPITALGYEYVVAGNGLFVRAENDRLEACVPVAPATLHGLPGVEPFARLKVERVPCPLLWHLYSLACWAAPSEAMFQLVYDPDHLDPVPAGALRLTPWRIFAPDQVAGPASVLYEEQGRADIDLHSHGMAGAFFSRTDDGDEQGLRFYAVIGNLGADRPTLRVRAGVYGHHWPVPASTVFDGLGPFTDESWFDAAEYLRFASFHDAKIEPLGQE